MTSIHDHQTGVNMTYLTMKEYKLTLPLNSWSSPNTFRFFIMYWFDFTNQTDLVVDSVLIPFFTLIVTIKLFTVRLICKLIHHLIKDMFEIMLKLIRMPYYLHCKMLIGIVCFLIRLFINKWICWYIKCFHLALYPTNFLCLVTEIHPRL